MQAIAFEAQLKDSVIHLPEPYRHWRENRSVKVVVLSEDQESPRLSRPGLLSGEAALISTWPVRMFS